MGSFYPTLELWPRKSLKKKVMCKLTPALVYGKQNQPHVCGPKPTRCGKNSREKPRDTHGGGASSWVRGIATAEMEGNALLWGGMSGGRKAP